MQLNKPNLPLKYYYRYHIHFSRVLKLDDFKILKPYLTNSDQTVKIFADSLEEGKDCNKVTNIRGNELFTSERFILKPTEILAACQISESSTSSDTNLARIESLNAIVTGDGSSNVTPTGVQSASGTSLESQMQAPVLHPFDVSPLTEEAGGAGPSWHPDKYAVESLRTFAEVDVKLRLVYLLKSVSYTHLTLPTIYSV